MYENGSGQFIEVLFEAKNITDFLNKAEYISTISDYDRDMLKEFQDVVAEVEAQEQQLQKEYDEIEAMQNELIEKQETVETLISEKDSEIDEMSEELQELKEAVATAERKQRERASSYSRQRRGFCGERERDVYPSLSRIYPDLQLFWMERSSHCRAPVPTIREWISRRLPERRSMRLRQGLLRLLVTAEMREIWIIINHGNGLQTYYMHCHKIYVKAGQKVSKGQNIAIVGTTGNSTGPHLHFQVMSGGTPVNPQNYL